MESTYAIITPAHNEEKNLRRLAVSLARQSVLPARWVIVENGSDDGTLIVARSLADSFDWVDVMSINPSSSPARGAPIVRAVHAALSTISPWPAVIVNVDADVSVEPDYFERLLEAFRSDDSLGICSGSCWELEQGEWRQRFVTGGTVWGATRAYRRECLADVLPLAERHGWDGIDQLKARSRGWTTRTILDLQFRHHRPEGGRDDSTWAHWTTNGDTAYFMQYRPWYLVLRALHQMRRDPAACGLLWGYVSALAARAPRLDDPAAVAVLRADQHPALLCRRRREALGTEHGLRDAGA